MLICSHLYLLGLQNMFALKKNAALVKKKKKKGRALMNGIRALIKEPSKSSLLLLPCEDTEKEASVNQESSLQHVWHLLAP